MVTRYFFGASPIGKDAECVVVEGHISVDLFESVQGILTEGVTIRRCSDNVLQIRFPPSFVFNLHQRGLTTGKRVVTGTRTMSFGSGCS